MTWWILLVGFLGGLGPWATTITTSRMVILVDATTPITNLHVTLRGKKYVVEDPVTTVQEVQERIATLSGIDPTQQGRVLFDDADLTFFFLAPVLPVPLLLVGVVPPEAPLLLVLPLLLLLLVVGIILMVAPDSIPTSDKGVKGSRERENTENEQS